MITGKELINSYYESEKLYSTGDEDLDDLLEKAFSEGYEYAQREFNSKAQKAMRRKWDLEQGMKANDLYDGRYLGLDTLETDAKLSKARDQYLDYGTKKTNELIGKAQKHVKHPGIVIGLNSIGQTIITSDKSRTPVIDISDKEEKEKAENAIKLLQAGRARSRSINKYKTGDEFENRSMIDRLDEKITKNKGADSGKTALGAKIE